ncbi:hypothetical protein RIF29_11366 [Crotalaria pallida]|uniref:Uncharacterized protein n=1 Tax=Crotalaria pallida TaxID=3830 RepID=A0AAN9IM19_CROPI
MDTRYLWHFVDTFVTFVPPTPAVWYLCFSLRLPVICLACRVGWNFEDLDDLNYDAQCDVLILKREIYGWMFPSSGIYFKKHVTKPLFVTSCLFI